ncbi:Restriction of telomere capping protein 5 [Cytospora mali]|uniref:Restriction of telomere capping protein 5 n=1 Tax=Cytospora mali TaxID=578113 RepID=A0A194UVR8_CYTMA|nr:Restriction of telomere capping protein 5 [Valsa mali var. pyri (nom. inval.)]
MGQGLSHHDGPQTRTREELRRELAEKFATKCFTSLELYSLKDNFKSLADNQQGVHYLKEDTVAKFLEIPDVLHVSPVLFQMISFLGAFPFLQDAPAVLGLEELVMAVTILTERYQRVLSKGVTDRRKLLFKSLAVYDRNMSVVHVEKDGKEKQTNEAATGSEATSHARGFEIDQPGDDEAEDEDDDEDDGLVLSTFELLDVAEIHKVGNSQASNGAMIPADNFRKLVMLLLLLAPLSPQERLSQHPGRIVGEDLESLRSTAESVLAAFLNVEKSPGIRSKAFNNVLPVSLPFIFDGFNALFEHFLFSKNLDFTKHKEDDSRPRATSLPIAPPLLQEPGSIMNATVVSQLSFFIPGSSLFRRLRPLYSGDNDGFSMGSFETKVFNWRAPTILLVSGTRITSGSSGSGDRFAASLPPKRFPDGSPPEKRRLTFGLYVSQPWRHSHKECFGDSDTLLFQLDPIHDVFRASTLNKDYVSFMKPGVSSSNTGIAVGNPIPKSSSSYRRPSTTHLGSVSLLLDSSFEFGVFTHDYTSRGGAFQNSASRKYNFQDRFEIDSLEVWGCGGDDEAKGQAERWAWEAREAEARRRINLGSGDIEADRALLEMAGLIGGNRSGGSMA